MAYKTKATRKKQGEASYGDTVDIEHGFYRGNFGEITGRTKKKYKIRLVGEGGKLERNEISVNKKDISIPKF